MSATRMTAFIGGIRSAATNSAACSGATTLVKGKPAYQSVPALHGLGLSQRDNRYHFA